MTCFGVGGFPVIERRTANSASVLNFLIISINLAADGVEQAAALLRVKGIVAPFRMIIIISPRLILEYSIIIIPKAMRV